MRDPAHDAPSAGLRDLAERLTKLQGQAKVSPDVTWPFRRSQARQKPRALRLLNWFSPAFRADSKL